MHEYFKPVFHPRNISILKRKKTYTYKYHSKGSTACGEIYVLGFCLFVCLLLHFSGVDHMVLQVLHDAAPALDFVEHNSPAPPCSHF